MKYNISKVFLFSCLGMSAALTSCDDQIMEWGTPDGHGQVTKAEIPLAVKEVLANYSDIKAYAPAGSLIGIGMGADMYVSNANGEGTLATANYQLFTPGNAMKMDAVVQNNGTLKFETVDALIAALQENNMPLYGHNFIWHTQQQQTYLKSLIAPDVQIISDPNGKIENIVENSDFENGNTNGWGAWSSDGCTQSISAKGEGYEGDYAIKLSNPKAGANYSAQAFYTLPQIQLEAGDVYILSFYVKADHSDPDFQAELQNRSTYSAKKYFHQPINAADKWYYFEEEFEITDDIIANAPTHITIDFGGGTGNVWLDNVQFGKKKEGPANYCSNGSFENGIDGWDSQNRGDGIEAVEAADAIDGKHVVKMTASASSSNYWDLQLTSAAIPTFPGEKVRLSFYVKSNQAGAGRVSFSSALSNQWPWMNWTGTQSSWTESFETSTNWMLIDVVLQNFSTDFKDGEATWTFNLDFGSVPGVTYYIDDVKVTLENSAASARKRGQTRAGGIIYTFKTPEEKREALLGAMDTWIKGMADHLKEKNIVPYGYDVINEPITDGDCKVRGVDNVFGGSWTEDDVTYYDEAPEETEAEGLSLNWGSGHFYWGYYVPDFAVQAFQKARAYLPAETKLFVNDYNLESNPKKLEALIKFAKDIDAANGSPVVDGIGTQMHVSISPTDDTAKNAQIIADLKAKVDAQFQTMAATGKLVRVTELDITLGTGSPSSAQYQAQADAYRVIAESYFANVPAAQQSGITIWSLSDNEAEHEYWLNGQVPNLFDKDYLRKWAYKGFCDGLAGEDLGLKYGGEDYKAYYEKNNVSSTVK
ncbi:MAG: endo-1,4-beta-xylanase [Prevotella sp.]|nr:endo-1,4-beta-xylanase [Prevotella sp.]